MLLLTACGDDEETPVCTQVDGVCVGVPSEPICDDDACTQGASCNTVLPVTNEGELDGALASANPGDCIALSPGSYGAIALPAGVSLLGRSAHDVRAAAISLATGDGALLRGVRSEGGIDIASSTNVQITAVQIADADVGIHAGPGSSLTVKETDIRRASTRSVWGEAPASIVIERTIIADAVNVDGSPVKGKGVEVYCGDGTDGCSCTERPSVTMDHVLVKAVNHVGVNLVGSMATMKHVKILETGEGPAFQGGGGLTVAACSTLEYTDIEVRTSDAYGVLIDSSSAGPVSTGLENVGIIIGDTMPGIWVQSVDGAAGQAVTLRGLDVVGCRGTGVGFDLGATGIIIGDTRVADTAVEDLPIEPAAMGQSGALGLGVVWKGGSQVSIDGLSLSGNGSHGFLIDGAVGTGSSVSNVTLGGGDEEQGIVQQQVDAMAETPTLGANVSITQDAGKRSDVPQSLPLPSTN